MRGAKLSVGDGPVKRNFRHSPTVAAAEERMVTALDAVAVIVVLAIAVIGLAIG